MLGCGIVAAKSFKDASNAFSSGCKSVTPEKSMASLATRGCAHDRYRRSEESLRLMVETAIWLALSRTLYSSRTLGLMSLTSERTPSVLEDLDTWVNQAKNCLISSV